MELVKLNTQSSKQRNTLNSRCLRVSVYLGKQNISLTLKIVVKAFILILTKSGAYFDYFEGTHSFFFSLSI